MIRPFLIWFSIILFGFHAFGSERLTTELAFPTAAGKTYVHQLGDWNDQTWKDAFLGRYIDEQRPPEEWFNIGYGGGLWTAELGDFDLTTATFESLSAGAYLGSSARIVFAMKTEAHALWSPSGEAARDLWLRWRADLVNQSRLNRFTPRVQEQLRRLEAPTHSEFYADFDLVGYQVSEYFVITNPGLIRESVLIVLGEAAPERRNFRIFSRSVRCSDLATLSSTR